MGEGGGSGGGGGFTLVLTHDVYVPGRGLHAAN